MDFYIKTNEVFTRNEIQPVTKIWTDIILYNISGYISIEMKGRIEKWTFKSILNLKMPWLFHLHSFWQKSTLKKNTLFVIYFMRVYWIIRTGS